MLKNREVTVKIGKKASVESAADEKVDDTPIEVKVRRIVHALERPAKQLFAAVCIYVVLDTYRQVQVAKASNPIPES